MAPEHVCDIGLVVVLLKFCSFCSLPSRVQTLASHAASRLRVRELRLPLHPARLLRSITYIPGHPRDQSKDATYEDIVTESTENRRFRPPRCRLTLLSRESPRISA